MMAFVYSCCFWFSLRLGGILIGLFSLIQSAIAMAVCIQLQTHTENVKDAITTWIDNMQLGYSKNYFQIVRDDPHKFTTLAIVCIIIYVITTLLYIYGAYTFRNVLLMAFILMEFLRLLCIFLLATVGLLILKENIMDIGILIGASVASGFMLLGMFYLWVCAANLPIVINEMEREEQAAVIAKLERLLESKENRNQNVENFYSSTPLDFNLNTHVKKNAFIIPNRDGQTLNQDTLRKYPPFENKYRRL